ncbi:MULTISPECIES: exopolysaccharide production repressor protein [unclassified Rhizobium]|uniref:exopolysaccharide production repressor protein n=1 Tax=unclassified Rhizobium TaxID=2613769 RepID=UPI000712D19C|nr:MULTISPECIES: exopolysaccharide production repressor protein [unclassified Rhizobium]KQS83049.1 exopolysaccharide production repressor exox [Rhizobium sp. Leaf386]KQS89066.1 exopolysaccharide production repressor exox [Rhizobium sp. Leaf391]KQT92914.1 exopolysaccharide production repressor exox [Rhizobium sp. Leaf453]
MFAPRVFVSIIGVLVVFAAVTFFLTGSAWTTAWQTVACAVLIQIGYFIGVMILVARTNRDRRNAARLQNAVASTAEDKDTKTIRVQTPPRHFNT